MLSMPSRHPKLKQSSRGNLARAPPPLTKPCTCNTCWRGMPPEHLAGARIPAVLGKASNRTIKTQSRPPSQQHAANTDTKQTLNTKPPPRAVSGPNGSSAKRLRSFPPMHATRYGHPRNLKPARACHKTMTSRGPPRRALEELLCDMPTPTAKLRITMQTCNRPKAAEVLAPHPTSRCGIVGGFSTGCEQRGSAQPRLQLKARSRSAKCNRMPQNNFLKGPT